MTVRELSERVAHYCDEKQVEEEDYFFTVLNGAVCEITARFPEVASVAVSCTRDSQTLVKMREAVNDFASFSFPLARVNGVYLPDGSVICDTRLGEIILPRMEGEADLFYHRLIPRLDRDSLESKEDIGLPEEKVELVILLTAYHLLVIDDDDKADAIKTLYDEAAYHLEQRSTGVYIPYRSVDGWA